jgi:hypothetical protein
MTRVLVIEHDRYPVDPREFESECTTMYCKHKKYRLGDINAKFIVDDSEFSNWHDYEYVLKKNKYVFKPIYMYDHGGITLSASRFSFSCPWDSGRLGVIYISPQSLRMILGVKRIMKKDREWAGKMLVEQISEYNGYLNGNVYFGKVIDSETGEVLQDSVGGFYGEEPLTNGMSDHFRWDEIKRIN